jgi:hypothetical protein
MSNQAEFKEKPQKNGVEGEGSYTGTREYNKHLQRHQKEADVDALADKARKAVEGPEGPELKRAEEQGKRGPGKQS